jgi:hypothetical protein
LVRKIGDAKKSALLGLSQMLTICHAARVIIDKMPILGDRSRHSGHPELLLKSFRISNRVRYIAGLGSEMSLARGRSAQVRQ